MNRALFLDRDGVLIEDVSYPHRLEDLHLTADIIPHLLWAQTAGIKLIIVTNQAGIAKGKFTMDDFVAFQSELIDQLKQRGVDITKTYFCPCHKEGIVTPFNIDSPDRKPKPGMFLKAEKEFNLDLSRSYMIGDKFSDNILVPELKCFILESGYTREHADAGKTYPDLDTIFGEIKKYESK